jgi:hypothetical protein
MLIERHYKIIDRAAAYRGVGTIIDMGLRVLPHHFMIAFFELNPFWGN